MATYSTRLNSADRARFATDSRRQSLWYNAWRRLTNNKAAMVSLAVIGLLALIAIAAPLLAPHPPLEAYPDNVYRHAAWVKTPGHPQVSGNWHYPLGTDLLGRDVLSRLIYGTRTALLIGFIPMLITLTIGTLVGLTAGFYGGWVDALLMRLADIIASFPAFLFFIIVMTVLKDTPLGRFWNGLPVLFGAMALVNWVDVARLVRGDILRLRHAEFVEAARALGVPPRAIVLRHLLPNVLGPIIISGAFLIPGTIIAEATLSYLGIGLRPATDPAAIFPVSWGNMILDGKTAISAQPWLLLGPALAVATITLAFTFLGDGLRDALDPRSS